jgi:hypothetical protein
MGNKSAKAKQATKESGTSSSLVDTSLEKPVESWGFSDALRWQESLSLSFPTAALFRTLIERYHLDGESLQEVCFALGTAQVSYWLFVFRLKAGVGCCEGRPVLSRA